jgi:S1-C subfamily serine protease
MSRNTLNSPSLDGLGFAISADVAAQVANQIIEFGFVRRATLGITVGDVRGNNSISLSSGIYVDSVVLGGASYGYLEINDIIVSIDKMHAFSPAQVASYLLFKRPGDVVNISYIRNGVLNEVAISLGRR